MFKKARKPRGVKQDGTKSENMCPGCISFGCDPMSMSHKFRQKIKTRKSAGTCPACGNNPCKCKSSLSVKSEPICAVCGEVILGKVHQQFSKGVGLVSIHSKCR